MTSIGRLSLSILILFANVAGALVAGPAKLVGIVKSFDPKIVVVETETAKFEIPKDLVGDRKLAVGEKVELLFSLEQTNGIKTTKKTNAK